MKETTVKLSGVAKDRFIERLFTAESTLDPAVRNDLIARTKAVFTSVRVRKAALKRIPAVSAEPTGAAAAVVPVEAIAEASDVATSDPVVFSLPPSEPVVSAAPVLAEPVADAPFDPYAVGLVPVFQREGRDGLIAKLGSIAAVDQLRQMAKAQQIVLPQGLRSGEATPADVRDAIADAVAKRIADRKAAAR